VSDAVAAQTARPAGEMMLFRAAKRPEQITLRYRYIRLIEFISLDLSRFETGVGHGRNRAEAGVALKAL
jgi:hypothetical protein